MHNCRHGGWGPRWSCGGSFVTVSEDTRLVNFSTSAQSIVTSLQSSRFSCSSRSIFCVCMCELNLNKDIRPLLKRFDLMKRNNDL